MTDATAADLCLTQDGSTDNASMIASSDKKLRVRWSGLSVEGETGSFSDREIAVITDKEMHNGSDRDQDNHCDSATRNIRDRDKSRDLGRDGETTYMYSSGENSKDTIDRSARDSDSHNNISNFDGSYVKGGSKQQTKNASNIHSSRKRRDRNVKAVSGKVKTTDDSRGDASQYHKGHEARRVREVENKSTVEYPGVKNTESTASGGDLEAAQNLRMVARETAKNRKLKSMYEKDLDSIRCEIQVLDDNAVRLKKATTNAETVSHALRIRIDALEGNSHALQKKRETAIERNVRLSEKIVELERTLSKKLHYIEIDTSSLENHRKNGSELRKRIQMLKSENTDKFNTKYIRNKEFEQKVSALNHEIEALMMDRKRLQRVMHATLAELHQK